MKRYGLPCFTSDGLPESKEIHDIQTSLIGRTFGLRPAVGLGMRLRSVELGSGPWRVRMSLVDIAAFLVALGHDAALEKFSGPCNTVLQSGTAWRLEFK